MAKYVGKGGTVSMGGNLIGNLNSWSLEETSEPIPQKSLGDEYQSYSSTTADHPKDWSGSCSAFFDDGDTAQSAMIVGAELALILGLRGTTTAFPDRTGNVVVTGVSESADTDGMVEVEFTFAGNGALTRGTF